MKIAKDLFHECIFYRSQRQVKRIYKLTFEGYQRNDIHCGSTGCQKCSFNCAGAKPCLDTEPESDSNLFGSHYLVPDGQSILDQIDVFEDESITNVIILVSVLRQVRFRSSVIYKRLLDLIGNKSRKIYLFENLYFEPTRVEKSKSTSHVMYYKRLYVSALKYFSKHFDNSNIDIVAVTQSEVITRKLADHAVQIVSVEKYVNSLQREKSNIVSKLRVKAPVIFIDESSRELFPPYLTSSQISEGIRKGELLQGTFHVSGFNFLEGSVTVESYEKPILISGYKRLNRAIDSDVVAVKLLPESEWSVPADVVIEDDLAADLEELEKEKLEETKRKRDAAKLPTGQIVGIIRRKRGQLCGIIEKNIISSNLRHLFTPADRRYPRIRVETCNIDNLVGKKIIIGIDDWSSYSRYPSGHFVRIIGDIGDQDVENEVLLLEHDVPYSKFSVNVMNDLPKVPWIITDEDRKKRVDLRNINICSVDPPGCTDIDDALHCYKNPDGTYCVGVHIADVSHFIRPNTSLDAEATKRGTTVYLVDKRIDMVPELLSSDLCSLREHQERFAFSCVWTIDQNANIVETKFFKSIICSKRAFTYEEAQLRIDDKTQNDDLTNSLRYLNNLAKILKKRRLKNGALVLSSPEVRFNFDTITQDPISVKLKTQYDTMSMVEEFMLLANISVAKKIYKDFPECAVLRRHPEPPISNFEPLIKAAKSQGFEIKVASGKELATSLDKAVKKHNPYFNNILRMLATRCMLQAVYFSTGMLSEKDFFHYGLAVDFYTHFTSPIRRYADIMVHRLLAATIGADSTFPAMLDNKLVSKICENLNYRNRMAQYAGRASVGLNTHRFFKGKVLEERANILYVRKNALQVIIPKYGLEGTVYVEPPSHLSDNKKYYPKFEYDEELQTQTSGDITLRTFDTVKVRLELDSRNIQHEKIVFSLLEPLQVGIPIEEVDAPRKKIKLSDLESNELMECEETNS